MAMKKIALTVAEAVQDDVNKGIVRIDSNFMREIGVRPGDIVQIKGERDTVAIVDRAYPGDIGINIIRADPLVRRNSKSSIGEQVTVQKADVKEAKSVSIAPAKSGIVIRGSPNVFKQGLLGRALVKGDIVSLGGTRSRRTAMSHSPFFDDVFSMLDENLMNLGFGDLKFVVVSTSPKDAAVIITENTQVTFNPEAKETSEEIALEVSYEDIGGLREEIKKIREMVELPLKHPEVFERLGIEPPKGVLLHGPPGTGKTLLAKAVANETRSHFILINGPEIMSKFYGQSLPGDEKLLVLGEEGVKRVPIEDVVNQKMEGKVACFDKKGDVIWSKIVGHIQHKRNSPLVKLTTRSGRTIKVTKDHSLFTLTKKGIESVPTSELTPGTSFVAVPKHLPEPTTTIGEINLLDLFAEHDDGVMVRGGNAYLKEAFTKIGREEAARILGVKVKYTYDIICKNVGIRVSRFVKLMDAAKIEVDPYSLWIATKGKRTRAVLSITQELCHFFGWWLAEGSYTNKNEVRLSIHSKEVDELVKLCTGLFRKTLIYRKNANSADIYICAGILGKVMKKLGFKGRGRTKTIPSIIYNLDNICLAKFISGYVSGDGSVNKKTGQIEICTESPGIADDMSYLLLRFDIVAKTYNRPGRPQKRICFGDRENLEKFLTIGFTDEKKNQIVGEVVRRTKGNRRDRVPLEALENINSSWKGLKSIGLQALTQLQALPAELEPALQGDIYWDRVISITPCEEQPEHVYDISVEPCQNFIAGFGGVFAHNSEENIRKKFEEAEKNAPSIIFIDEIDAIAAKREETRGEVEKRVVAQLLALMDGLKSRGKVVVIAATNVPNILDPALRRPGRFDREIEIGVPRYEGRLNILKIHTRNMPLENVSLDEVSRVTHGFVGADLASLAKESAMVVLRKVLPDIKYDREEAVPTEILEKLKITNSDFKEALKTVRPSAMREVLVEVPNVPWDSVGGLDYVKQELKEAVEWPLKSPQAFRRLGVNPPKGILLYGPPGTGKTLLAKAVATESEANFILVNGPQLLSKWVGESEKAVRKIFEKARQTAPSIVFFDELDALAPQRGLSQDSHVSERVVNQLLSEIDGVQVLHDIVIIGATNRPDIIDSALLRPGRFDRVIMAPVPDEKTREKIFEVHLKKMPIAEDVKAEDLAKRAEGYVGADIESICREAAIFALRKDMDSTMVTLADFEEALYKVRASVTPEIEKSYKDLEGTFKQKQGKRVIEKPAYFG